MSGLCPSCVWSRRVATRRASEFLRCARSDRDPAFPRYPRLPVLACRGFEPAAAATPIESPDEEPRR